MAKCNQLGSDYCIASSKVGVITVKKELIVKLHVDPSQGFQVSNGFCLVHLIHAVLHALD